MSIRASTTASDVGGSVYITTEVEHDGRDSGSDPAIMETFHPQDMRGDARIRWVYFMLGAATLLSWNGMSLGRYGPANG
jgi:equilibrative nucleoside transporter 1/2/3